MLRHALITGLAALALVACKKEDAYDPAHDYFSFANTDAFVTDHLHLDLGVDFDNRQLHGTATLAMRNLHPLERQILLDTRDLQIKGVKLGRQGEALREARFRLGAVDAVMGQALEIDLPEGFDPQGGFEVEIAYVTSPGASALQWLPPELTAGGKYPFLFSQSQSIHARSWIPLQDTPVVRMTYTATLRTPPNLLALMSANNDPLAPRTGEYHFEMPQPIPSYLMAIAVGNVFFAAVGEDTGVYAEPEVLNAAAFEFGGTQDMLEVAEAKLGPYEWGRYDLLILPPSFPYGGMENPRLSFITPSVLAGDRSLVSLIAHELAHSWSGNLVTNATWRDIWINEGTTSYLDSRLMEEIFGKDQADEERVLNWEGLQHDVANVATDKQPLAPKLLPSDGEGSQQSMYYAKGQFFLEHMEHLFGREVFDPFLAGYFKHFSWQSITTEQFLDYLDTHLLQANPGIYTRAQAEEWLYQPGVPADAVPPVSDTLARAALNARAYAAGEMPAEELARTAGSPHAVVHFINSLPTDLSETQLSELDAAMGFSASRNAEIGRAWFIQVAKRRHQPAYAEMRAHLVRHGRMKLVTPVYQALAENGEDEPLAREIFAEASAGYHPLTIADVERAFKAATNKH